MEYVRTPRREVLSAALVIPASPVVAGVPASKVATVERRTRLDLVGGWQRPAGAGGHRLDRIRTAHGCHPVGAGFDTNQWTGNACLTASARRLVVVYGPRTFTNRADLFNRGGFTVVDLPTGAVAKVPIQSSLAYFNPAAGQAKPLCSLSLAGSIGKARPGTGVPDQPFTIPGNRDLRA